MSSTEQEQRLREFFQSHIVPVAGRLRARGVEFFPMGPEDDADDWYYNVPPDQPEVFELDPANHVNLMKERWNADGLPELAALTDDLFALADSIELDVQDAELSGAIYVMH